MVQSFVVVVNGDGQHPFGGFLTDHIIIQNLANLLRGRHAICRFYQAGLGFFTNDVHAKFNAFITDENGRTRDQLSHLMLAFAAKRAVERVLGFGTAGFAHSVLRPLKPAVGRRTVN